MKEAQLTELAFQRRYSDESGIEFSVSFDRNGVSMECQGSKMFSIPLEELDWFIAALEKGRSLLPHLFTEQGR